MKAHQKTDAIRVFLVSNHSIILWGLQHLIQQHEPALQIAGSATSCKEAIDLLPEMPADVILADLNQDAEQLLEAIPHFLDQFTAKTVLLSRMDNQALIDKAVLAGACGIIDIEAPVDILPTAIAKVYEGQMWLDRATTNRIFVNLSRKKQNPADQHQSRIAALTRCERKVIAHLVENAGAPGKVIASKLAINESTLRNHLSSIYGKLHIINRHGLIAYAIQHGLNLLPEENS